MNSNHRTRINSLVARIENIKREFVDMRGLDEDILEGMTEEIADATLKSLNSAEEALESAIHSLNEAPVHELSYLEESYLSMPDASAK